MVDGGEWEGVCMGGDGGGRGGTSEASCKHVCDPLRNNCACNHATELAFFLVFGSGSLCRSGLIALHTCVARRSSSAAVCSAQVKQPAVDQRRAYYSQNALWRGGGWPRGGT